MNDPNNNVEGSVRRAFELLIQMREHRQATQLLHLANSYLRMLLSTDAGGTPVVVSIRTVRIRQP
ncbi:MAG: hypothetical protein ACRD11_10585 [Terriglobia bacterium]